MGKSHVRSTSNLCVRPLSHVYGSSTWHQGWSLWLNPEHTGHPLMVTWSVPRVPTKKNDATLTPFKNIEDKHRKNMDVSVSRLGFSSAGKDADFKLLICLKITRKQLTSHHDFPILLLILTSHAVPSHRTDPLPPLSLSPRSVSLRTAAKEAMRYRQTNTPCSGRR